MENENKKTVSNGNSFLKQEEEKIDLNVFSSLLAKQSNVLKTFRTSNSFTVFGGSQSVITQHLLSLGFVYIPFKKKNL